MFAADKLSKVRELRLADRSGTKVQSRKLKHYRLSLAMLQERLPDSSLVAALAADSTALKRRSNDCPLSVSVAHQAETQKRRQIGRTPGARGGTGAAVGDHKALN